MRFGRCWNGWMRGRPFWMLGEVGFEVLEVGTTGGGWGIGWMRRGRSIRWFWGGPGVV